MVYPCTYIIIHILYYLYIHLDILIQPYQYSYSHILLLYVCFYDSGFHTKWSSSGRYVMIVMRSIHPKPLALTLSTLIYPYTGKNTYRRQNLFIIRKSGAGLRYLLSWQSYKPPSNWLVTRGNKSIQACDTSSSIDTALSLLVSIVNYRLRSLHSSNNQSYTTVTCQTIPDDPTTPSPSAYKYRYIRDGNHPNWAINSHHITMNLEPYPSLHSTRTASSSKAKGNYQVRLLDWSILPKLQSYLNTNPHIYTPPTPTSLPSPTSTTPYFNDEALKHILNKYTSSFRFLNHLSKSTIHIGIYYHRATQVVEYLLYNTGSGHPTLLSGSRYIITDAYSKERGVFDSGFVQHMHSNSTQLAPTGVPVVSSAYTTYREGVDKEVSDTTAATATQALAPKCVPLRLIDLQTQKEIWLAQVRG